MFVELGMGSHRRPSYVKPADSVAGLACYPRHLFPFVFDGAYLHNSSLLFWTTPTCTLRKQAIKAVFGAFGGDDARPARGLPSHWPLAGRPGARNGGCQPTALPLKDFRCVFISTTPLAVRTSPWSATTLLRSERRPSAPPGHPVPPGA